jgi:biopolymer transport protein ExbD
MGGSVSATVELNLMPFIDIFSLLTTFLLFSAVFVHIGILEVQIPFLTNAPPPPTKSPRSISVKVELEDKTIIIGTEYSEPPIDQQKYEFEHSDVGIAAMHKKLIEIRSTSEDNDKLTLYVDDTVIFSKLTKVLDEIKFINTGEHQFKPVMTAADADEPVLKTVPEDRALELYPKVVMGSVMI